MKEIKIYVDGKEVKSLDDLVCMFVDNDIPEPYKNATEYLYLEDLSLSKIVDNSSFNDFYNKIQKRIKYAREHNNKLLDINYDSIANTYLNRAKLHDYEARAEKVLDSYYKTLGEIYNIAKHKKNEN